MQDDALLVPSMRSPGKAQETHPGGTANEGGGAARKGKMTPQKTPDKNKQKDLKVKPAGFTKKRKLSTSPKKNLESEGSKGRNSRVQTPCGATNSSPKKKNSSPKRKKDQNYLVNVYKIIEQVIEAGSRNSSPVTKKSPERGRSTKNPKSTSPSITKTKKVRQSPVISNIKSSKSRPSQSPSPRRIKTPAKSSSAKSPAKDHPEAKWSPEEKIARSIERVILQSCQNNCSFSDLSDLSQATATDQLPIVDHSSSCEAKAKPKKASISSQVVSEEEVVASKEAASPKKRGRPKGSKNKIKNNNAETLVVEAKKSSKKVPASKADIKCSPSKFHNQNVPIKKRDFAHLVLSDENCDIKPCVKPTIKESKTKPPKVISSKAEKSSKVSKQKDKIKSIKKRTKKTKPKLESVKAEKVSPEKSSHFSFSESDEDKTKKTKKKFPVKDKKVKFAKTNKREINSSSESEEEIAKPPKKAIKDKWSREVKKEDPVEDMVGAKALSMVREKRARPFYYEADDSESDSDDEDLYLISNVMKEHKPIKKTPKKAVEVFQNPPRRAARMASLNAIAMMACMNEDAKVPLASPKDESMALVLKPSSTVIRNHSDSDSDSDNSFVGTTVKRKSSFKEIKNKKRKRRNELDVQMDMKDMVVTKRMASLNASAIMAASYCMESRNRKAPLAASSRESEVTNVDIKRKISYKATKSQSTKTRSVITVQETTKKVKKAQGSRETEVEEHIIVKKRVKRQSGVDYTDKEDDNGTDNSEIEILPKSPDSGMIVESTITYVTTQTVPQTVTLSGVSKYCITSTDGKTTTVVQQVQRKSTTTSTSAPIPTAHIPPNQHVQGTLPDRRRPGSQGRHPNYSPLGALEVMQPAIQPPPPAPFITYTPPHHHLHHAPHMAHHYPHPYPPLAPHSPPYPPPPPPPPSSSAPPPVNGGEYRSSPSAPPSSQNKMGNYNSLPPKPSQCPSFRDDRGRGPLSPPPPPAIHGLTPAERHHSAFSAPTPSAHSPAAGSSHVSGYQPVSGPIPSTNGGFKSQQTSPAATPSPYNSPSRLTSPPPSTQTKMSPYQHTESYQGAPPYQSYSYPYDKYPRGGAYHMYQPPYGGQDCGYPPPHYSQESYASYTLCVPAPPPPHTLALPPPPTPSSPSPHHNPNYGPPAYQYTEFTPVFSYPSQGPPNSGCCPPNAKPGPPGGHPRIEGKNNYQYYNMHPQGPPNSNYPPPPNQFRPPFNPTDHPTSSSANRSKPPLEPHTKPSSIFKPNTTPVTCPTNSQAPKPRVTEEETTPVAPSLHSPQSSPPVLAIVTEATPPSGANDAPPPTTSSASNEQTVPTTWVVPKSDSSTSKSYGPTPTMLCSSTSTTSSISLAHTNAYTNPVMSTTAPIVTSLEKIPIDSSTSSSTSDEELRSESKTSTPKSGRHLLCQPFIHSRSRVSSVLAKPSKPPANDPPIKPPVSKNGLVNAIKDQCSSPTSIPDSKSTSKVDNKESTVPRKRGRPPKNKDLDPESKKKETSPQKVETIKNGLETKHFLNAPGETSAREDQIPKKAQSLLKSSGAKTSLVYSKKTSPQSNKDIKIKTETVNKIKAEKVSPPNAKVTQLQLINGEVEKDNKMFPPPPMGFPLDLSPPEKKLKSEESSESEGEKKTKRREGTIPKCLKFKPKRFPKHKPAKIRRKASLLAYLKEKNNESDNSTGDLEPPIDSEEKGNKPSPFPTYTPSPIAVRGRRSSGTGKGKLIRKQKPLHGWSWEGAPHEGKIWLRNDEMFIIRKCYKAMKHKQGDTIQVRDCVLLRSGPKKTDLPFVAKVAALWEDSDTGDMMMSILWYYRPEHTDFGRREEDLSDEIFASKHRDHLSVACIEDRCYVLTFNEYCRYRSVLRLFQERLVASSCPVPSSDGDYLRKERQPPGCVVQELLFFCRKVYDYRQKRILKNPC